MTARGERRRRAILDATLELVGREGTAAVTHRAVAAEAGVPLAATTYYFDSKEALIREALADAAASDEQTLALIGPSLERAATVDELLAALMDLAGRWLGIGRTTLIAHYELCLEAARRPELEELARAWTDTHVRALAPALARAGAAEPERAAWLVATALDGMVFEELAARRPEFESDVLRPALERLLRGVVAA